MTDILLSLIPDYGLYLVALAVFIAAIGIPLPSSVLMVTSGGLAGTGDLNLYTLLITGLVAYVTGDQIAYAIGAKAGPQWIENTRAKPRMSALVTRAENLYQRHGTFAVLLSRTVLSPCGPGIAYLSGASGMQHGRFSVVAALGATAWVFAYTMLGFVFAGHVPAISAVVASALAVAIALLSAVGFGIWLAIAWHRFEADVQTSC